MELAGSSECRLAFCCANFEAVKSLELANGGGVGRAGGGVCCIFLISVVILLFFYFALNVTQLCGTKIAAKMNSIIEGNRRIITVYVEKSQLSINIC